MQGENQTIELDCPPGSPRPGDLIEGVIAGTGLELKEAGSKLFGNWTWYYKMPEAEWAEKIQPVIGPRIEALYHAGLIRWGSW
jgi:hypothetical protein